MIKIRYQFYSIILLMLFAGCKSVKQYSLAELSHLIATDTKREYEVTGIVDGDTFKIDIDGTEYRVRLIGVDTPESSNNFKARADAKRSDQDIKEIIKMGKAAKDFVRKYLIVGNKVRLETDIQPFDKYSRILAYVYLKDNRMLNEILVKEGYAQVMTVPPNVKYHDLFLKTQRDAMKNERGLWATSESNNSKFY